MQNKKNDLLNDVAEYYTTKLAEYGETPLGVDWNGEDGQILRFEQLCKIVEPCEHFSLNDLGCGYGALYGFLLNKHEKLAYSGIDVAEVMIHAARQRYTDQSQARFIISNKPDQIADYSIASGIFNVRLGRTDDEWLAYLKSTLDILNNNSSKGFAFNCLTSYSDRDKMRDYLYYADPCKLFDLCKRSYSRNVALLHDYGLYEFTILVRKQA